MASRTVTIPTADGGQMGGYLSAPAGGSGPGIIVLQEIFGVNAAIKAAADDFAAAGFVALAPDLFWRIRPGITLGYSEDERKEAFGHMGAFDGAQGSEDARSALEFLKGQPECTGEAAYVGFCLGGKLAVTAAAKGGAAAAVSFYGVKLQDNHAELRSMPCPLQIHVGDNDAHVPMEVVNGLREVTKDVGNVEIFIYPGAQHAFFNKMRDDVFDPAAAATAMDRSVGFMKASFANAPAV